MALRPFIFQRFSTKKPSAVKNLIAKLKSFGLQGINGYTVEVETDINNGLPAFETVGLPGTAIKESRERVRSAIKNSFFNYPATRIIVNLAPADTKKEGPVYDLPIAVCILAASEQVSYKLIKEYIFLGELSLDGRVRKVNGILPILIAAVKDGCKKVIIPKENEKEASFVKDLEIFCVESLSQTVAFLKGETQICRSEQLDLNQYLSQTVSCSDFKFIKGQYRAKRVMEIAAAGGHNILLIGPPGAGKTMIAKALPGILPDLTPEEALESTKIHSVAGTLDSSSGIVYSRPFRTPHHTSTTIALIGGGNNAKPGEISLAHNGILYLDELPEYNKRTLEALRQPLEDNKITLARLNHFVEYPANFMLVASMNPCPCGNFGSKKNECKCSPASIQKYISKLSGPLLDRIDLHIEVDSVEFDDLMSKTQSESSTDIKKRIDAARAVQTARLSGTGVFSNSKMTAAQTADYCAIDKDTENLVRCAFDTLKLSARGFNRILKVARTIADLESSEVVLRQHIAEAIQYRTLDKKYKMI